MIYLLNNVPWYVLAALIIGGTVGLSLCGLLWVRKRVGVATLKQNHDVASTTFGIVGLIYGVLLGFIVVNVHERYTEVSKIVDTEANLLLNLYRDAEVFPPQTRDDIRLHIRKYVEYAVINEWPKLRLNETISMQPPLSVYKLWHSFYKFVPSNVQEQIWYDSSVSKLNDFSAARISRLFDSHQSQGVMMWTLLIAGGAITIFFMYFFGAANLKSHMIMTALLSGCIAFMLFLIFTLDAVYSGGARVEPTSLIDVMEGFDRWEH